MNSYLSEFLSYFMPDLELPAWLQAYFGLICLFLFFKVILALLGGKNGRI